MGIIYILDLGFRMADGGTEVKRRNMQVTVG